MGLHVVTGASRGIGLALVRHLRARGAEVLATCREPGRDLEATGARVLAGVDLVTSEGVARLVAAVAGAPVQVLVNNAGVLAADGLEPLDVDAIRRQLEVNAIAPLRVTAALLPSLGRGAKVAFVTSRMGSLGDNTSGGYYGYRMSKAALNMAGVSLARDLTARGVAVALLHPGFVRTDMTGGQGNLTPDESARLLLERIDALSPATSGRFWHASGEALPW